jgi:hypothetical protein
VGDALHPALRCMGAADLSMHPRRKGWPPVSAYDADPADFRPNFGFLLRKIPRGSLGLPRRGQRPRPVLMKKAPRQPDLRQRQPDIAVRKCPTTVSGHGFWHGARHRTLALRANTVRPNTFRPNTIRPRPVQQGACAFQKPSTRGACRSNRQTLSSQLTRATT